jgi:organic radical activating enzyme
MVLQATTKEIIRCIGCTNPKGSPKSRRSTGHEVVMLQTLLRMVLQAKAKEIVCCIGGTNP